MFRSFEWRVGLRYTRAKRRNHFISFISLFSILGIGLGVAALIIVLSVMNGFQREVRGRILSVVSHIDVNGPDSRLALWEPLLKELQQKPGVVGSAAYVQSQGLLSANGSVKGAIIRGIDPVREGQVADFYKHMSRGQLTDLKPGTFGIVIGNSLANDLNVAVGEKITLITPQGQVSPAGILPRLKQFTVVGIFKMDMYEYDSGLALISLPDGQKLFKLGDDVSGIRLKLKDLFDAPRFVATLKVETPTQAFVNDWTHSHANYFEAVALEKRMMFIILTVIVMVAAFNLVSTLVMVVTDKQSDIAILRTMGATPGAILRIFLIQGTFIGLVGTALGTLFGLSVALNIDVIVPFIESIVGQKLLPGEIYLISKLPAEVQWTDVFHITMVSLIMSFLMTIYPSWRAARVQPAEALRYE